MSIQLQLSRGSPIQLKIPVYWSEEWPPRNRSWWYQSASRWGYHASVRSPWTQRYPRSLPWAQHRRKPPCKITHHFIPTLLSRYHCCLMCAAGSSSSRSRLTALLMTELPMLKVQNQLIALHSSLVMMESQHSLNSSTPNRISTMSATTSLSL